MTGRNSRAVGVVGLVVVATGLVYGGAAALRSRSAGEPGGQADPPPATPVLGSLPLFYGWPKDTKPAAVVVLSGQTFGYVQPCGCSRPQMGGLERRANFIESLKAKGWPVVGADLGDLYPPKGMVPEQSLLKYTATMNALREMGYLAVGVGKTELNAGLFKVLGEYALQTERPPFTLAGNILGVTDGKTVPREAFFPPPPGGTRPLVGLVEVKQLGGTAVGVVGVVGKNVAEEGRKADPLLEFEESKDVLKRAVAELAVHPRKPVVNVLLYQGTAEHARAVAKDRPEFHVILCQADDSEPPQFSETVDAGGGRKTMVIQVGHKGRYVGAVGVFKKPDGGYDLKYQLVPLGEEYMTKDDPAAEKANKALQILEEYARQVRDRKFLEKVVKKPNNAQLQMPTLNLTYVGSEKCMGCHPGEHKKWSETPHGHALEALEKVAKRPGLRNLDGECVVCHTVGYEYKTGFETVEKTPHLKHVGCESCHGPGSGHLSAPNNADLLKLMTPWKPAKGDKLPDVATMERVSKLNPAERGQVVFTPAQNAVINGVSQTCTKCHDAENDPHFDLFKYWPKINHSGLGQAPAPK